MFCFLVGGRCRPDGAHVFFALVCYKHAAPTALTDRPPTLNRYRKECPLAAKDVASTNPLHRRRDTDKCHASWLRRQN